MSMPADYASYVLVFRQLIEGKPVSGSGLLRLRGLGHREQVDAAATYKLGDTVVSNVVLDSACRLADQIDPAEERPDNTSWFEIGIRLNVDHADGFDPNAQLLTRALYFELGALADLASGLGFTAVDYFG